MRLWFSAAAILLTTGLVVVSPCLPVQGAPPFQGPTDEPTKPPYIFPTPIFIPTYPGDTAGPTNSPVRNPPIVPRTPSRGERVYIVVQGDNPWVISQKVYGGGAKYKYILDANALNESSVLKIGMVLRIPGVDAQGNLLPIAAPRIVPTEIATTENMSLLVPTVQVPDGTPVTIFANPNPKSSAGGQQVLETIVNVIVLLLLAGSAACGAFAYVYYRRAERLKKVETLAKRIHSTK